MLTTALFAVNGHAQPPAAFGVAVLPRTRMEAGIAVREHDAAAFTGAPQFVLDPVPLMIAGGANGAADYDLTYAYQAVLLSDGRLATLATIGNKLLIFDTDGRGQRVVGRTGEGPGEFMAVNGMFRMPGDTLFLPDGANNRLNWVLADRGVVKNSPRGTERRRPYERAVGLLPGGRFLMTSAGLLQEGLVGRVTRPSTPVFILTIDGNTREVTALPDYEIAVIESWYRGRPRNQSMPLRFSRSAQVLAWDTLVATAVGDGYRIDLRNAAGVVLAQLRVAVSRRVVTRAMRERAIEQELSRLRAPSGERMVDPKESERLVREQPFADSLPPYHELFTTAEKTLWVVDAIVPGDCDELFARRRKPSGIDRSRFQHYQPRHARLTICTSCFGRRPSLTTKSRGARFERGLTSWDARFTTRSTACRGIQRRPRRGR